MCSEKIKPKFKIGDVVRFNILNNQLNNYIGNILGISDYEFYIASTDKASSDKVTDQLAVYEFYIVSTNKAYADKITDQLAIIVPEKNIILIEW